MDLWLLLVVSLKPVVIVIVDKHKPACTHIHMEGVVVVVSL